MGIIGMIRFYSWFRSFSGHGICRAGRRRRHVLGSRRGVSTLEIVIIAAILIGLALIFKDRITELVGYVFDKIFAGAEEGMDFGISEGNGAE